MSGKLRIVLKEAGKFKLIKQIRPGRKTWYEIEFDLQAFGWGTTWAERDEFANSVNQTLDPTGTKTFKKNGHGRQRNWRFWSLIEAEQLFTFAVIKFS